MDVLLKSARFFVGSILLLSFSASGGIQIDAGVQAVVEAQEEVKPINYGASKTAKDVVDERAAAKNYVTDPAKPVYFAKGDCR